jgi:radical SAM superfamily enzyme YgiQ (UPF0313 family)
MRIALVNVQLLDANNLVPPLGALYVAAELERAGHQVAVVDGDPEVYPVFDEVMAHRPEVVGVGFLTASFQRAVTLMRRLREALPGALCIAGGVHPTVFPEETLRATGFDVAVVGEGEGTARELLERHASGQALAGCQGAVVRVRGAAGTGEDDAFVDGGRRALPENLDELPLPAWHLIDAQRYLAPPGLIRGYALEGVATVFATRGCPYTCIYCGSHQTFGRRMRTRSAAHVIAELTMLRDRYGARAFYFCDDLFTFDREWVYSFCQAYREALGPDLPWACQTRVDCVDAELFRTMRVSGCVQIDFGVESGSERIQEVLSKRTPPSTVMRAFELTRGVGLRTCATFIIGNPHERAEDIAKTFALARRLDADYTAFYFSTPYPGTRLWEMALEAGWVAQDSGFNENWTHRQPKKPVMEIHFKAEELVAMRRTMQNAFFIKNYVRARNLPFYARLLASAVQQPAVVVDAARRFLATGRLDDAAEALMVGFERQKLSRSLGRAGAAA